MSALFQLPHDVVALNVIAILSCADVVKLDSASCSRNSRNDLHRIFSSSLPFDMNLPYNPARYSSSLSMWKWFWKRNMCLKGIEIHRRGMALINLDEKLVHMPVTVCLGKNGDRGFIDKLDNFPSVLSMIGAIILVGQLSVSELAEVIPRMLSLTSIVDENTELTEEDLIQLFHPKLFLQKLSIKADFSCKLLGSILLMGPTLRSLSISTSTLKEEHYRLIAQHCPHLTTFHLGHYHYNPLSVMQGALSLDGVAAIARGCRKLQDVKLFENRPVDDFLLLFATHCPELRKIDIWGQARLTDTALSALSTGCPLLVNVTARWDVRDPMTVYLAADWLAKLTTISFEELEASRGTISAVLAQLCNAEVVHLWRVKHLVVEDIECMTAQCSRLRELCLSMGNQTNAVATSMAKLVRHNSSLETICMNMLTKELLDAIAESCPRMRHIESFQPQTTLADHTLVSLAKGCPLLRDFQGCSGWGITDVFVLALSENCRHLERADLRYAHLVTESALLQLIARTAVKAMDGLGIDESIFSAEALVWMRQTVALRTGT